MGIDLLGPFTKALAGKNYLVVAIDRFTKWIEVKALASIATKKVKEFFFEYVICCFGIPKILISNNEKLFDSRNLEAFVKNKTLNKCLLGLDILKLMETLKLQREPLYRV